MNLRRFLLAMVLLVLPSHSWAAEAPLWSVEEESRVGFVAMQSGAPVEGRFESFTAEIRFDPDNLEGSAILVEIDVASVNSESQDRDQTIRSDSLFDVATWPTARFRAERFEKTGEQSYEAHGRLTMRDVTREVVLPFTLEIQDHPDDADALRAVAKGELTVMRLDYGIGQGLWQDTSVVANEVIIRFEIVAERRKG